MNELSSHLLQFIHAAQKSLVNYFGMEDVGWSYYDGKYLKITMSLGKKHLTEAATAGVNCCDVDASVDFNADKHPNVTYDR